MKVRLFFPHLFFRDKRAFTLMEVLLTTLLISWVLSATVQTFVFISRVLEYARIERNFLHQIVLTDQLLKNIILSSEQIENGTLKNSARLIEGKNNYLLYLDTPEFSVIHPSVLLRLCEMKLKKTTNCKGKVLVGDLIKEKSFLELSANNNSVLISLSPKDDFSISLFYTEVPFLNEIRWKRIGNDYS